MLTGKECNQLVQWDKYNLLFNIIIISSIIKMKYEGEGIWKMSEIGVNQLSQHQKGFICLLFWPISGESVDGWCEETDIYCEQ